MKKLLCAACLLLPLAAYAAVSLGTAYAAVNLAMAPIGRTDLPWWKLRFEQSLAAAKADPNAEVIWLGDSITHYWQRQGTHGYDDVAPVWNHYYGPYHALNFGFIGDTTASLIWRLDHGQVAGLHPKLTIILIGANNLGRVHWGADLSVPGIESVVTLTHRRLPASHILLLGVLPSIRSPWVDQQTRLINAALAQHYANDPVVTFEDVGPLLLKNGHADASLYVDPRLTPPEPALHPDAEGMTLIARAIAPIVAKYAG
ncbi:GDSL-type esterase/lipase family protein [Acidocella sp.]|jgi:lysophospholipase L1-like esterase|uniref:GDSL-type esterase/lipase family protein n=1 Tax=Acidocella sp. TaxID=50710 RepID=UPI002F42B615